MFDSDILEVAIGLALVFALVSTICTAVREGFETFLKTRASYLEYGIRQLLNDPNARGIAKEVFDHPLISGLYIGSFKPSTEKHAPDDAKAIAAANDAPPKRRMNAQNKNLPSYIPSANFARALLDVVARGPANGGAADASSQPITLARVRGNLANIDNPHLQRALLSALDAAEGDINLLRKNIEGWYDSAMDRVSGWYKRTTQKMLFVIAFVVVAALNVNTVTIADYLFRHDAERTALVAGIQAPSNDAAQQKLSYEDANKKLEDMHLPIGWTGGWGAPRTQAERFTAHCVKPPEKDKAACDAGDVSVVFAAWDDVAGPIVGWLLTALAAMLGAPFWFDVLSKFMTVRSTVKPREPEKKAEAKDADAAASPGAAATSFAAAAATAEASADAHAVDDHCGVGSGIPATPDDRLPAATGGVA